MGRRNKVIKLTEKKIRYIIRAKTRNDSTKNIALDMKLSESTVKRVWMHWIRHHEPIPIKKFGRKKKEIDEGSEELILEVHEEQKLGARRLVDTVAVVRVLDVVGEVVVVECVVVTAHKHVDAIVVVRCGVVPNRVVARKI